MGYAININSGALFTDIASSTTNALGSFSGPAIVIMGVLLAFLVVESIIGLFRKRDRVDNSVDNQ